ncbi:hypothetical protein [Streptomyces sp. CBMA156]|uniref:hypothetical protein n=1 Tax=Streptomyces sp. CBMA156 TaxID=1930280 RepID=UPI001661FAD9|nr:hypothetical protein [Streptomyces sp. CBMA156]
MALRETVARYAVVRDRLAHKQVARAGRDRLLGEVELAWAALSTAHSWSVAHHTYVLAVDEARIAIGMWRERAETALGRSFFCFSDRDQAAYRQIQEAGHLALEQEQDDRDPTPAVTAKLLRGVLDQAHERRTELAGETLRLQEPETALRERAEAAAVRLWLIEERLQRVDAGQDPSGIAATSAPSSRAPCTPTTSPPTAPPSRPPARPRRRPEEHRDHRLHRGRQQPLPPRRRLPGPRQRPPQHPRRRLPEGLRHPRPHALPPVRRHHRHRLARLVSSLET